MIIIFSSVVTAIILSMSNIPLFTPIWWLGCIAINFSIITIWIILNE